MNWQEVAEQANTMFERLAELHKQFTSLWLSEVFLTWRWFFGVGLILVPWIVWFIVRKKQSADRLLYAGFTVMIMSSFMDVIGIALGLWSYPFNVFPLMPEFIPFDVCALPVVTMLFIQYFPKVKPIYKALIYSALGSFIFQPLMKLIALYDNLHWEHYYSFPILVGIYLVAHRAATRSRFESIQ